MRNAVRASLVVLLALGYAGNWPARADDPTIRLRAGDPEMEAAIAKARNSLPVFWKAFENPAANEQRFSLKVMMPYSDIDVEHIWVTNLQRKNGKIYANVNNEPQHVTYVRFGKRIEFDETQISDWMYRRDGKIVGNFTMRPLLARMPREEADRYRAMLAEP